MIMVGEGHAPPTSRVRTIPLPGIPGVITQALVLEGVIGLLFSSKLDEMQESGAQADILWLPSVEGSHYCRSKHGVLSNSLMATWSGDTLVVWKQFRGNERLEREQALNPFKFIPFWSVLHIGKGSKGGTILIIRENSQRLEKKARQLFMSLIKLI